MSAAHFHCWSEEVLNHQNKYRVKECCQGYLSQTLSSTDATRLCHVFHLCLICPIGLPADSHLMHNKFTQWFANDKHFSIIFPEGELSFFISVNQALGICKPPKSQSTFLYKKLFKYILLMFPLIGT